MSPLPYLSLFPFSSNLSFSAAANQFFQCKKKGFLSVFLFSLLLLLAAASECSFFPPSLLQFESMTDWVPVSVSFYTAHVSFFRVLIRWVILARTPFWSSEPGFCVKVHLVRLPFLVRAPGVGFVFGLSFVCWSMNCPKIKRNRTIYIYNLKSKSKVQSQQSLLHSRLHKKKKKTKKKRARKKNTNLFQGEVGRGAFLII